MCIQCVYMFAWVCLRTGYPNSNGSWIIYDYLSCSRWQRLYILWGISYTRFSHTPIYNSTQNHCGMCTLHISVPNHVLWMWKEGGNRVKWRPHIISTQALRSYPWPVGFAQTCLVHSFIHKNYVAKAYLELSNCQSWAESRYVPSSPKKNHTCWLLHQPWHWEFLAFPLAEISDLSTLSTSYLVHIWSRLLHHGVSIHHQPSSIVVNNQHFIH
jgi:hypothetical protein